MNEINVTGWLFIVAGLMSWLGWVLLPVKISDYFEADVFGRVGERFHVWIWLFRLHLFGYLVIVMAFVALGTLLAGASTRILLWPGVAVCGIGLIVAALAQAFYYHFGAWGALGAKGKTPAELESFVQSLAITTEYVTCLVRFSRVFFGLGQVVLAVALLTGGLLPGWIGIAAGILGVAAMALTMGLPDHLGLYRPVFHLNCLWLVGIGVAVLRQGVSV